jgi:sigma-B regulation protein RsbU (phosphoserine phosphatase)
MSADAKPAAIQFLFMLANAIARLCYQEFQLRQRVDELTAVYTVTTMLADARDLQSVLQRTARVVCEVMQTMACSIRLVDLERDELVIKAVHNLSKKYLDKGPVRLSLAEVDKIALSPKGYEFVKDATSDPRVLYPMDARDEGIVSMLSVGMRYKGKPIGVLRVYTDKEQTFSNFRIDLVKAVAAQAAAAIENARLVAESIAAQALERQVQMAAEVQKRMIPSTPPEDSGLELASVYVPCYELGGDFFDFITLPYENLGMVIADVSGKGVPASLIMASVRAALRAQVDNVYYLYEVIRRINLMLCRDTKLGEFVTLFYGVYDSNTRRLTYCNAGHPAALILRKGKIIELPSDGMVLGVDPEEKYGQAVVELQPNDLVMLYTDGLTDAMNFDGQLFGRQRVVEAFLEGGQTAEAVAQNILWHMSRFTGLTKRTDDVTLIVARVRESA